MLIRGQNTKDDAKFPSKIDAVHDADGNPVRGLWLILLHGGFKAQATTVKPNEKKDGAKVSLNAGTLAKAEEELMRLVIQSRDGTLPPPKGKPTVSLIMPMVI